jgi:hypothetical protein
MNVAERSGREASLFFSDGRAFITSETAYVPALKCPAYNAAFPRGISERVADVMYILQRRSVAGWPVPSTLRMSAMLGWVLDAFKVHTPSSPASVVVGQIATLRIPLSCRSALTNRSII